MTALLVLSLALPLAGVVAVVVRPSHHDRIAGVAAGLAAAGWAAVVAGADPSPVVLGRLEVDPLDAAAAVGLAVLVAIVPAERASTSSLSLTMIPLLAAAASVSVAPGPARVLAAGVVILSLLAALRLHREHAPLPGLVLAVTGALVAGGGLVLDDPERAAVVVLGGAGAVLVSVARWPSSGLLLVPPVLLAAHRATEALDAAGPTDPSTAGVDAIVVAGVVVGVLGAAGMLVGGHRGRPPGFTSTAAAAGLLLGLALLGQDLGDLRAGAVLLVAGATLAAGARHPVALLALAPGVHAVVESSGQATATPTADPDALGPELVALAAVGVLLLLATLRADPSAPSIGPVDAAVGAFGVVPVWSWAGARTDGYLTGTAVGLAVASIVVLALLAHRVRVDPAGVRAASSTGVNPVRAGTPAAGTLGRRPRPARPRVAAPLPHGSTHLQDAGTPEADHATEEGPEEPAVAVPQEPVPDRAPGDRGRGRRRLRARPSRPSP